MSRCSLIFLASLFFGLNQASAEKHLVNLSYWNWNEEATLSKDGVTQSTLANFSGLGLEYEFSSGLKSQGWSVAPAFILGQATLGDATGDLVYVASYQKFFGATTKATWFWRIGRRVYLEAGGIILYRAITWPGSDEGITASAGPQFNYGLTTNMRIRMTKSLDFCQSFGTLLDKGQAIWSAGFGYRF